jgi:hypothetical protein
MLSADGQNAGGSVVPEYNVTSTHNTAKFISRRLQDTIVGCHHNQGIEAGVAQWERQSSAGVAKKGVDVIWPDRRRSQRIMRIM